MAESADLTDITDALSSLTGDFTSAYKAVNAPSSTPVQGSPVPGRPGYVYGAGGSIFPVNPATGLPVVNSTPVGGTSTATIIFIVILGALGGAFLWSLRH